MASSPQDDIAKAKKIVFHLLKYRSRSRKEIQDRLKQKMFSESTIREACDYFDRLNLIDDQAFANSWLNSRLGEPFGLRRIFFELRQKGIAEDIIEEAQNKIKDTYNEYDVVSELAKGKYNKLRNLQPNKAKMRIYNFLMRRGFSADIVNEVVSQL